MKMRHSLLIGGLVLLCASVAMAGVVPGQGFGSAKYALPQTSSCVGDFGGGTGVCNIFEEPDNAEVQDFDLGSSAIGTGLVDIYNTDGVTLSDSLDFYFNGSTGTVHLLFQSEGFAQSGGFFGGTEDAAGNWCYLCGFGNNVYMGVSPETSTVPEPSSLLLLGSSVLGFAGLLRRKLF